MKLYQLGGQTRLQPDRSLAAVSGVDVAEWCAGTPPITERDQNIITKVLDEVLGESMPGQAKKG